MASGKTVTLGKPAAQKQFQRAWGVRILCSISQLGFEDTRSRLYFFAPSEPSMKARSVSISRRPHNGLGWVVGMGLGGPSLLFSVISVKFKVFID